MCVFGKESPLTGPLYGIKHAAFNERMVSAIVFIAHGYQELLTVPPGDNAVTEGRDKIVLVGRKGQTESRTPRNKRYQSATPNANTYVHMICAETVTRTQSIG